MCRQQCSTDAFYHGSGLDAVRNQDESGRARAVPLLAGAVLVRASTVVTRATRWRGIVKLSVEYCCGYRYLDTGQGTPCCTVCFAWNRDNILLVVVVLFTLRADPISHLSTQFNTFICPY